MKGGKNMATMDFQGKQIEVDDDGYLLNLDDWTKDLAVELAKQDGVELTDSHWEVINFLREYYKQYQIAPMIKILVKEIGKPWGLKKATQNTSMSCIRAVLQNRHANMPGFQSLQAAYKSIAFRQEIKKQYPIE